MVSLAIQLPDEQAQRLAEMAQRLKVSPEELAAAHVLDLLARPEERFEQAARYAAEKNTELYRRLA